MAIATKASPGALIHGPTQALRLRPTPITVGGLIVGNAAVGSLAAATDGVVASSLAIVRNGLQTRPGVSSNGRFLSGTKVSVTIIVWARQPRAVVMRVGLADATTRPSPASTAIAPR